MSTASSASATLHHGPAIYYVIVNGRRLGPLPAAELRGVGLKNDSWVWRPGVSDWQRAEQIDELRTLLNTATPPSPKAIVADTAHHNAPVSIVDFQSAMTFVAGIVLCYLVTGPLLSLFSWIGLGGGVIGWFIEQIPIRVCCSGAGFFFARATHLPFVWGWAIPAVLNPLIGSIEAVGLVVFARHRLKAAGIPMGLFGPRSEQRQSHKDTA